MKKLLLLISLVSLSIFTKVQASHVMGADLTFSCLGPNQYLVTLTGYRDCNGITLDGPLTLNYSSSQCGVNSTINLNQVGGAVDITPACFSTVDACNGGNGIGIQKQIFQGILNLPPGCGSDWVLSWSMCCRNTAITTLSNPGNEDLYIEAHLNNTLATCDNSPAFSNDPVAVYCNGFLQLYNQGAIDANGDSLHFYLMPSLNGAGSSVAYSGGHSATNPLTTSAGTTIDPNTGQLTFTPSQSQVGVMKVGIDEYRGGVLIGHVERDMQIIVTNCTNSSPTGGGINGTASNTYNTTACSNFCFTIQTSDANAADSIFYTWVGATLPGATITSNGAKQPLLTICWAPTQADAGTHTFVLNLRNNACPYYGTASIAYTIVVAPTSDPPVDAGTDVHLCQGQSTTLTATSAGSVTSYTWSDGTSTHSGATWTVSPAVTTVYTVTAVYANGCQLTDQVTVFRNPKPTVTAFPPISTICSTSDTVQITAIATNAASYNWFPSAGLTCTTCQNPKASPTISTTYSVIALDADGCGSDTFSVRVNLNSPPPVQSCSVIYATTTGTGSGSQNSPTNLPNALALAQCNNAVIKLAIGTYTVDYPIANIGSYTTIEGGFDPANNWIKSSLPGATTIFRSNLNMEGSGNTKRLVAVYLNGAQYIRFQDLTVQTANCPATAPTDTFGSTNYVFHMTNCSNYNFVRCQIQPGSGSDGKAGTNSSGSGAAGANGVTAGNSATGAPPGAGPNAGGNGGNGGSGGTASGGSGSGGSAGTGAGAGAGGGGGGGSVTCAAFGIFNGSAAQPGGVGAAGSAGASGSNGTPGTVAGGFFVVGGQGGNGTAGTTGSGGGGGGGTGGAALNTRGSGGGSGGSGGGGGPGGTGGYGGGGCFGLFMNNNGANGVLLECNIGPLTPGSGGAGGTGGAGGPGGVGGNGNTGGSGCQNFYGNGGNGGAGGAGGNGGTGAAGSASRVYIASGSPLTGGDTIFGLVAQPTIFAANISCTFRNDTLSAAASGAWTTGAGATVPSGTGTQLITQYTTTGRKDIGYNANVYSGFVNIALDQSSFIPVIQSSASVLRGDTFFVCQGSTANFNIQIASADTFSWDFGGATVPNTYYGSNVQNLTGLTFNTPGTYMVVANIKTSCCGWSPYDTAYILVEPQPTITYTGTTSFCPGDSAHIILTGTGNGYLWSPVAGVSDPTGADVYLHPLSSTTYLVTSLSPRGLCNADTTVPITVLQPATLSFTIVPASCGSIGGATVNPNPAGSYTYQWSPTGSTSASISNQPAGNYSVTVTPAGSTCSVSAVATIGTNGGLQAFMVKSISPSCNGQCNGQLKVKALGGTAPFTYSWAPTPGAIDSLDNLCAQTYSVTITDANSCTASVSQVLSEPLPLSAAVLDSTGVHCAGQCSGTATVDGQGGTGPYTFAWSTAVTPTPNHPTNLCVGSYTITVTDRNGCTGTGGVSIGINAAPLSVTFNTTPESCPGKCNATTTAVIGNGIPPYTYAWTGGPTTATYSNLCAGIYSVIVTDSFNCPQTVSDTVALSTAPPITVTFATVTETCPGLCNASSTATVSNGTAPYSYVWSSGATTATAGNLCDTIYTLTVSDVNTCTTTVSDTIAPSLNPAVTATFTQTPISCPEICDGTATATVNTGTAPYLYAWSNGNTTNVGSNLCDTTYTLTVTDANTCSASFPVTIAPSVNSIDSLVLTASSLTICSDKPDTVTLYAAAGSLTQAQINFIWSTGQTDNSVYNSQVTVSDSGIYTLIAEKGGCRTTLTQVISGVKCDSTCGIAIANAFTPNGDGKNDIYRVVYSCPMNSFSMRIYNRWGEKVYETTDIDKGWDGNYKGAPAAADTYVWFICSKEKDISPEVCKTGKLTLIR